MNDACGVFGHPRRRQIDDEYFSKKLENADNRKDKNGLNPSQYKDSNGNIKNIKKSENTRSMTALMGPSGSGKVNCAV